jgi:hypothetical protein
MHNENKKLNYRTYHLVIRQLNGINKGVQIEHSAKRFVWKYRNDPDLAVLFDPDCPDNETTIMLDGGTHQEMVEIQKQLEEAGIKHSFFNEPDLNNCLTAITLIADERVWDVQYIKSYSDVADLLQYDYDKWLDYIGGEKNVKLIEILGNKRLSQG